MPSTTIGFIGHGAVRSRNVKALLQDQLDAYGELRFILPLGESYWSDGLGYVGDFALDNGIALEIVADDTAADIADAQDFLKDAVRVHNVTQVTDKLMSLLSALPTPQLIILWDDEDEEAAAALDLAITDDIPAFDLTNGLDEIRPVEEDPSPEEEPVPDDAPDDAEFEPYTREELEELDLDGPDGLKAICEANEITLKPRSRKPTYVQAILDAQEGKPAGDEAPEGVDPATGEVPDIDPDDVVDPGEQEIVEQLTRLADDDDADALPVEDGTGGIFPHDVGFLDYGIAVSINVEITGGATPAEAAAKILAIKDALRA
jgi:hypothetical protein